MSARRAFRPDAVDRLESRDVPSTLSFTFTPPAAPAVSRVAAAPVAFNPGRTGLPLVFARMSAFGNPGAFNLFRSFGLNAGAAGLGTTSFGTGATTPATTTTPTTTRTFTPTVAPITFTSNSSLSAQVRQLATAANPFANRGMFDAVIGGVPVTLNGL